MYHARNYCPSLFYSLGRKGKDTPKEVRAKKAAQLSRTGEPDEVPVPIFCKSRGAQGHSTKRSSDCPNHNMTLLQLLNRDLGAHQ